MGSYSHDDDDEDCVDLEEQRERLRLLQQQLLDDEHDAGDEYGREIRDT